MDFVSFLFLSVVVFDKGLSFHYDSSTGISRLPSLPTTQSVDLLQEKEKESNGKTNTPVNRRKPWDCGSLKIKLENKKKTTPAPRRY